MASPVINYDPRMERIGYRYPPACGFMPAAGFYGFAPGALRHTPIPVPFSFAPPGSVLAIVRSTVTNVATQKEKPPMALVGLTLGVGQSWKQYANQRENLPFPRSHKPTKNIGGCDPSISISNSCHTVDNANSARKTGLVSIKMEKNPKHREITYKKGQKNLKKALTTR
jgi:hypothetical protein